MKDATETQTPFTCFSCSDGNTPLYCLNCAGEVNLDQINIEDIDRRECCGECEGCGMESQILLIRYGAQYCLRCWTETRGTR